MTTTLLPVLQRSFADADQRSKAHLRESDLLQALLLRSRQGFLQRPVVIIAHELGNTLRKDAGFDDDHNVSLYANGVCCLSCFTQAPSENIMQLVWPGIVFAPY